MNSYPFLPEPYWFGWFSLHFHLLITGTEELNRSQEKTKLKQNKQKTPTHHITIYLFTFVKSNTKWVLNFSASPRYYCNFLVHFLIHTLLSASKTSSFFLTFTSWSFILFHWENEAIGKSSTYSHHQIYQPTYICA